MRHLRGNIKAGLVARTVRTENPRFCIKPSQFPNDRLSPPIQKHSMHTPTELRRGFAPHSLSTDYALPCGFCGITDTLCDDVQL